MFLFLFTRISPVGICSLIAAKVAGMSDIAQAFEMLGYLMGTAVVGFFVHGVIVIPLIYFVVTRKNPIIYIKNLSDAMVTAYGTDSRLVLIVSLSVYAEIHGTLASVHLHVIEVSA